MEQKALTIHSEGIIILLKIDLRHTNSISRVYNECNCSPMCEPIDGWMIRYELFNSESLNSVVNEFCNLFEKNEVEYDFSCHFNNDKAIVNVWINNNNGNYKSKARRVFKWNKNLIQISNVKSFVEVNSKEMIEGIKYDNVSILSVFPQQLN
jgi:hypothetical protein